MFCREINLEINLFFVSNKNYAAQENSGNIRATYHCQFFCFILLPRTQINYSFFSAAGEAENKACVYLVISRVNARITRDGAVERCRDKLHVLMTCKNSTKLLSGFSQIIIGLYFPNICSKWHVSRGTWCCVPQHQIKWECHSTLFRQTGEKTRENICVWL